jgi:hypothetical protein
MLYRLEKSSSVFLCHCSTTPDLFAIVNPLALSP